MMCKIINVGRILVFSFILFSQNTSAFNIKTGSWSGRLQLNSSNSLPFKVEIVKSKTSYILSVINGEEKISLTNFQLIDDSIHVEFPNFNSKLVLKVNGKKHLTGYWLNLNKGINYKIPCTLKYGYFKRFNNSKLYLSSIRPANFSGKWETTFENKTPDAYKAIGLFNQNYNELKGTFLTETGDYRFLEGNVVGDSLYLSCFDGSHAFLFTASLYTVEMNEEHINGTFYSGKHWQSNWTAKRNELFELTDPDSLTSLNTGKEFNFTLKDLNGKEFTFPNETYKNKVTIIQIMGTWCPNCLDETKYFKQVYETYHDKGLEIISIAYETGNDVSEQIAKINKLKTRLDIDFQLLMGGEASKKLASEQFSMLNQIISFPTSIYIGKDGKVKKIHTGFNGPGTGDYYTEFVKETTLFIEGLLQENN